MFRPGCQSRPRSPQRRSDHAHDDISAMYSHGALHNTDILNELFEHLSLTPRHVTEADIHGLYRDDAAVKRQALAHAALTCKAFSKPASRVLWMVLHRGIQPFLRVFSNFHENAEEQWAVLQRLYKIEGETTSIEWAQFERLAARVRCVVFDVRPPIAESTLGLLKAGWEASKKPLFPNLSVVDWPDSLNDTHRGLLQVVCANRNLSSILIKHGFKYATTISPADLSVVARSSPKLLHLHIRSNWHTSWHAPLTSFRNLRSIRMFDVDAVFYRHLSTFQWLQFLSVYVKESGDPSPSASPSQACRGFPSLRRLEMPISTFAPPSTLLSMVAPITSSFFTTFVLGVEAADISDMIYCLESLSLLDLPRSFRKFHLYIEGDHTPGRAIYAFSDMSKALFKFRHLEDVAIRASTGMIEFTDADIA
ncbi:hypothetical protein L226DRAFT_158689 [Lentinus tigrinus ALCF2SS1-7]|uniref:uncharacterized protein n=1 Tax=Lentinus tigrinus ALCF2SS1-7 TaxID=1328758 RepID=UPI001165FFEF|nr:hypothetical protein L226DRAFT_158689 [Lentinus tigrinus ALCF2SS1-7]